MAISVTTLGASTSSSSPNTLTVTNTAPTGSTLIAATCYQGTANTPTFSDSGTNTWSGGGSGDAGVNFGSNRNIFIGHANNIAAPLVSGVGTIVVTVTSGTNVSISAMYATGLLTASALDTGFTPTPTTGNSTTPSITSNAAAQSGELAVYALGAQRASTIGFSQDTTNSWAAPFDLSTASLSCNLAGGQQILPSTTAVTASPTITSSQWGMVMIALKPAPVGGARSFGVIVG